MENNILATFYISGNTPSSKNNRMFTGTHFVASAAVTKWRRDTLKQWGNKKMVIGKMLKKVKGQEELVVKNQQYEWGGGQRMWFQYLISMLPKPLYIEFTFIRKSWHHFDYINLAQTMLDEMVMHDWIPDDNADEICPYFGIYTYNPYEPGAIIKLLKQKPLVDDIPPY